MVLHTYFSAPSKAVVYSSSSAFSLLPHKYNFCYTHTHSYHNRYKKKYPRSSSQIFISFQVSFTLDFEIIIGIIVGRQRKKKDLAKFEPFLHECISLLECTLVVENFIFVYLIKFSGYSHIISFFVVVVVFLKSYKQIEYSQSNVLFFYMFSIVKGN